MILLPEQTSTRLFLYVLFVCYFTAALQLTRNFDSQMSSVGSLRVARSSELSSNSLH
jgi:hypothetical protein